MCGIVGALLLGKDPYLINKAVAQAGERGRDHFGTCVRGDVNYRGDSTEFFVLPQLLTQGDCLIHTSRGAPTTEWNSDYAPEPPYTGRGWCVSLNGVIANDWGLREKYDLSGPPVDTAILPELFGKLGFFPGCEELDGGYAIVAEFGGGLYCARSFMPLYAHFSKDAVIVTSEPLPKQGLFGDTLMVTSEIPINGGAIFDLEGYREYRNDTGLDKNITLYPEGL